MSPSRTASKREVGNGVAASATLPPGSQTRIPPVRPGLVQRTRLRSVHAAAQRSRLVLVAAPAGYGKSTLVAQWCDVDPRDSSWVQLSLADNDPVVLITHIAGALARTGPVDQALREELSRRPPAIDRAVLPRLAAALGERDPFVLVLDDVHLITGDKSRAILAFLVDEIGPGSQLVLITRGDAPVPMGRLRAAGALVEVGAEQLALNAQETRDVAAAGGLELSETAAAALCERTEGWTAAVVLAALSLHGRDDAECAAASLSGDQAAIADYLVEEVLERQPEHLKRFLLATSVLERMSAPLCDAMLGTTDAAASLATLARSNAFVVPMDDCREWYRYHHLFRDLLRTELHRRDPELLTVALRRAAAWCEVHGTPREAFIYAHEAGDLAQAGHIALAHREELSRRGQSESIGLWLERCTDDEIASDPQLALAAAWVFFFRGEAARVRRFIAAAEQGPLDAPSADGASSLGSSVASIRSLLAPAGITQMLRDGEFIRASEQEGGAWLASGGRAIGMAQVLLGRPEEATSALGESLALLSDHPEFAHFRVVSLGYLAFAAAELDHARDLQRFAAEAARIVEEHHLEESAGGAIAATASAVAHQRRGECTEAERQLARTRQRSRHLHGITYAYADVTLRAAEVALDLGDAAAALELTEIAGDALLGYPDAGTLPGRLERIRERMRQGEAYGLSSAELRVLSFLPTHLSLQEIAERLYLARSTVKTHVASIYGKLGVPGRSEAVELIERLDLGSPPHPSA